MKIYLMYLRYSILATIITILTVSLIIIPVLAVHFAIQWHWWVIFGALLDVFIFPIIALLYKKL